MSITAERKAELIKEYAQKDGDTGSPEVTNTTSIAVVVFS